MLMKTLSRSISPSIINETFQTIRTADWWSVLCWSGFFKARVTITEEVWVKTPLAKLLKWLSHVYL